MRLDLTAPAPPLAERRPHHTQWHGTTLQDDFAWLRAENWREVLKDPTTLPADIRHFLDAENAYCAAVLAPTAALQAQLVQEMRGRIKEDDVEPAFPRGPFAYYTRHQQGGEHPIYCRTLREGGEETVLLDGDKACIGHNFFKIASASVSPDHQLMAWTCDTQGSEYFTLTVMEIASGRVLDTVQDTSGRVVWLRDSSALLYVRLDESHRDNRVFLHRVGTDQANDLLLHEEEEPGFFVSISQTLDGAYALIDIHDHETSEVRVIDPATPETPPRIIAPRQDGLLYEVEHHQGRFIILTNADDAKDFKIVSAPVCTPNREHWVDIVPHRPGVLVSDHTCFSGHMVRLERENAVPRLVIRDFATGAEHNIAFDEETYSIGFSAGYEAATTTLRFTYSSLTTPPQTFNYDMVNRKRVLLKQREIPSGHIPSNYITRRINALAQDGQTVPISLLAAKATKRDGSAPCLLYAYGSYGITIPANFRSNILSLVDRGFVFAIAHIRGGMEKGFGWYEDGKREKKSNTFTDYIASAEKLISDGYTRAGKIVAQGGSAGGMLMGAVANIRPDLFAGVVAEVPFVDVLTTMLDKDLPLTPPEWPEWGNPIESAADFATIRAYSPYDNVCAQDYPAMLIEGGLTDPRVTYWEPAKWAAKLRHTATGGGPILLHTNMEAGHGGASGRLKQLIDDARVYAFALGVAS